MVPAPPAGAPSAAAQPGVVDYGDAGILVTFTQPDAAERWASAQSLQQSLLGRPGSGVVDVVASFDTAFVTFDPLRTDHEGVRRLIEESEEAPPGEHVAVEYSVPVVYGGERGPDLVEVAAELGVSPEELVALHTSAPWTVRFRGSPVAAPLMDGLEMPASIRRNPTPRTRVPPGSVAVSGQQSIIYPVASPGGWRLLGQTPVQLFDVAREGLVPYRPGDRFRFFPVAEDAWDDWRGPLEARADQPAPDAGPGPR